ncbi:MAG TPA: cystathionine beta-lyase [Parvularculaceae bacterium]|nr:cystathionine beta-lyase [Parvularculaceae bacterium]
MKADNNPYTDIIDDKKSQKSAKKEVLRQATVATHGGPRPSEQAGILNPPVYRASTVFYPTVEAYKRRHDGYYDDVIYGLYGTKTTFALADAISKLENASDTLITSSGTAANALAAAAFLSAGDHLLAADCVYGTTRKFFETILKRFGVEISYFNPRIGDEIRSKFRSNTRAVFLESPGSQLFEMIDIPVVVEAARAAGAITLIDNTWATPLYYRPLDHGVDVSIQSGTKYFSGHSDIMLGSISVRSRSHFEKIKDMAGRWGNSASPDDCYLAHRGLRTLDVRMERHQQNAFCLIEWLAQQPEVARIRYPALKDDPGYDIWRRDYDGASGLFGVELARMSDQAASAFFDHLSLFGLGSSWGGYESLLVPAWPKPVRVASVIDEDCELIRVHAGLEDPADLIADLEAAFARMRAVTS